MISSMLNKVLLDTVVFLVLLHVVFVSASTLPLSTEYKLDQEPSQSSSQESDVSTLSKDQFRRDMARQLLILQQAETEVVNRIRQLEAERIALSQRKRSHYTSMCMFNVVACYKKRK